MVVTLSLYLFTILTIIVILFQLCLAAGLPWGAASMGGKYPGKYPPKMRLVASVNALVLTGMMVIAWARAGRAFPEIYSISLVGIWVMVVFFALGTVMNVITPSKIERIWAPVAFGQFVTSLLFALG
ncbi:hypothetical protein SAMN04488057_101497 [Cyclobacterium lianum]|uniref:Uncharacterized protein n=1 Tax=Cyclobacterium lianum TaxID=388280 RepID=A0A1M7IY28_9BACT|nr:hypothetical protein [Cyclobacterium lianum]SHM45207.1 hypothetical protein SAMN04488057_101497 [Cyclobacterium lianum]